MAIGNVSYRRHHESHSPHHWGIKTPPVEAHASTDAAKCGEKPAFFIAGIVTEPVPIILAKMLPLKLPKRPLLITATLAGPPRKCPVKAKAIFRVIPPPGF